MAPLASQEINLVRRDEGDDAATFGGAWNEIWTIGQTPQGGYTLSLMLQAAQSWVRLPSPHAHPRAAAHVDPLHVSATFLYPASLKRPFEIEVKPLKRGKALSLVEVRFKQPSASSASAPSQTWPTMLIATVYLTNFPARSQSADPPMAGPSISRDSPYFTRCGLQDPDELMRTTKSSPIYNLRKVHFRHLLQIHTDDQLAQRSLEGGKTWGDNGAVGAWFTLVDQGEQNGLDKGKERGVGYNWMPLICDSYLMPFAQFGIDVEQEDYWFPTLTMAIEFKRRIPQDALIKRWGHISRNSFLQDGQFDNSCEIWTHPSDNGLLDPPHQEQEGPQILAIARQLAISTSLSQQGGDKSAHRRSQEGASHSKL